MTRIAARLSDLGYSHIMMRDDLLLQWLSTEDENVQSRVSNFLRYRLRPIQSENGYALYEILPE